MSDSFVYLIVFDAYQKIKVFSSFLCFRSVCAEDGFFYNFSEIETVNGTSEKKCGRNFIQIYF